MDAYGAPAIDPTQNVISLVEAESRRQDDLREFTIKYIDSRLEAMEHHASLVHDHQQEVRNLETRRVDAVRQVDAQARDTAALNASRAIDALAMQVSRTADSLARTIAEQFDGVSKRLAALEHQAAMGAGKQAVADPAIERLALLVNDLARSQERNAGKSSGGQQVWGYVVGAVGLLIGLATFALRFKP